ncbi:MAG: aldo/keto reductase [Alphaproteobacteria bacterium]|nr:aldo/keto reductase [Alphaproteobacteria bacterium]MDP6830572.1 aldo/keto reductase [Alphaproteobacteria bacterium]
MQRRSFGKTDFEVSLLGFGGAPVGFLETEQREVAELLNNLLDQGVNLIDTAAGYDGSEEMIGKTIGQRRDEYILVSKCGRAMDGVAGEAWSGEVIENTLDRALKRLQTDHLDVMLLHSCELEVLQRGEAVGALVKAREAGKIRHLGYAGDNEAAAYAATLDDVAVIETSISICDQANVAAVLAPCQENNVGTIAKRSIANAAWKDVSEQRGMYVNYAATYSQRLATMAITPEDLGYAADAWPEIALRFTLSQPGLSCAIVGTTKASHVATNLAAAAKGPLPEDEIAALREAFQRAETAAGETWLGQT